MTLTFYDFLFELEATARTPTSDQIITYLGAVLYEMMPSLNPLSAEIIPKHLIQEALGIERAPSHILWLFQTWGSNLSFGVREDGWIAHLYRGFDLRRQTARDELPAVLVMSETTRLATVQMDVDWFGLNYQDYVCVYEEQHQQVFEDNYDPHQMHLVTNPMRRLKVFVKLLKVLL